MDAASMHGKSRNGEKIKHKLAITLFEVLFSHWYELLVVNILNLEMIFQEFDMVLFVFFHWVGLWLVSLSLFVIDDIVVNQMPLSIETYWDIRKDKIGRHGINCNHQYASKMVCTQNDRGYLMCLPTHLTRIHFNFLIAISACCMFVLYKTELKNQKQNEEEKKCEFWFRSVYHHQMFPSIKISIPAILNPYW